MQMSNRLPHAYDRLLSGDHLRVHVERDVEYRRLASTPEIAQETEEILDVLQHVNAQHQVKFLVLANTARPPEPPPRSLSFTFANASMNNAAWLPLPDSGL